MPFGSLFGAMVFGILGSVLGARLFTASAAPDKAKGLCVVVMGLAVAAGLLTKRSWARWLGVLVGIAFAALAMDMFLSRSGVLPLTVALAAAAVAVLLVVPATGRPTPASVPPKHPSAASRVLFGAASVAIVGFLAATAWAVAVAPPAAPDAVAAAPSTPSAPAESKSSDAHSAVTPAEPAKTGAVTWYGFADGMKRAKQDRKLMVADFYATWCGPCKMMERETFRDPRVMSRLRDVVPVRVNAEEEVARGGLKGIDLANRYAVEVYPTIVVLDGEGREIARNNGALRADDFLAWIDAVIERANTTVARS
jgi:thioredoxin 1